MRKILIFLLCLCAIFAFGACNNPADTSSESQSQEESGDSSSDGTETLTYRIYYDLYLTAAYVPEEETGVSYDEDKETYYTEVVFGEEYELLQPKCENYTFSGWKLANSQSTTFTAGVYSYQTDTYLLATWSGETIDSPFV